MKTCNKCKIEKPLSDFSKKKQGKYGVSSICKLCSNQHNRAYREANKEKEKARQKAYREANKDKEKAYREANKDKIKAYQKAYRESNKDKIKSYHKEYRQSNKDKVRENKKAYYEANKDKIREKNKAYYEANKDKINKVNKDYFNRNRKRLINIREDNIKKRKKNDSLFKVTYNTRRLIRGCFRNKGYTKKSKTYQILGCTYEEFKQHLERQFTKGMSWENYGEWHLDHIYPVSLAKNEEELIKLNHYTNFQPLWAEENLKKSNKIENGKQIKLL